MQHTFPPSCVPETRGDTYPDSPNQLIGVGGLGSQITAHTDDHTHANHIHT